MKAPKTESYRLWQQTLCCEQLRDRLILMSDKNSALFDQVKKLKAENERLKREYKALWVNADKTYHCF